MRYRGWFTLLLGLALMTVSGFAAAKTQARLVLAAAAAVPDQTIMAGLHLRMAPGWHTYWRNAGEAGAPTTLSWSLPPGITAGAIQWPVPEKSDESGLVTYIYEKEVVLLVPLTLASNLSPGTYELRAKADWLECEKQCLPGQAEVSASLQVAAESRPSTEAALIASWQKRLPQREPDLPVTAGWAQAAQGDSRAFFIEWQTPTLTTNVDFFPYSAENYEVLPATEYPPAGPGTVRLQKTVKKISDSWPKQITGLLVAQTNSSHELRGYEVELTMGEPETAATPNAPTSQIALTTPPTLASSLLYAFLGGLILNIMPCVLPVIALKILGFVNQSKEAPQRVRLLGLVYALGVLVSFLALAALVIGVKQAGRQAGWGMQFGNPQFLVVLTVLVTLVALNLFGLFEVNLGGRLIGAAGALTAKEGWSGAFFNGVLATVLATPCTAPFLGAALGFAFAQSSLVIVLILLTVGCGLAAPYVVLSWFPHWLKFLPKPGAWMEKFKVAMGFPMLATAVWLFTLLPLHYGRRILWLGLFLVLVALAAWIYGEFVQRGRRARSWAAAIVVLILITGYAYAIESQLRWRSPVKPDTTAASLKESPDGIDWQRWSPTAVAQARAAGRPVFVDFTADWCVTCQANKKFSIEIPSVRNKLKAINAVALLGDYTTLPPEITAELNRFSRAGVPLVLVYPKQTNLPPQVLPEVLTPQMVLAALDRAAQ